METKHCSKTVMSFLSKMTNVLKKMTGFAKVSKFLVLRLIFILINSITLHFSKL